MNTNRQYPPYDTIRYGGFGVTRIIPVSRVPLEVTKVSDNEVYAVYSDVDDNTVMYKQTWTAEGTGNTRKNPRMKIEKSVDGGNTWSLLYTDGGDVV